MIISYDNDRFEENITPSRVSFLFVSVVAGASLGHFTNLYQVLLACVVFMLDTGLVFRDSDWAKAIMLSAVMLVFYVLQARAKLVNSVLATARRERTWRVTSLRHFQSEMRLEVWASYVQGGRQCRDRQDTTPYSVRRSLECFA